MAGSALIQACEAAGATIPRYDLYLSCRRWTYDVSQVLLP